MKRAILSIAIFLIIFASGNAQIKFFIEASGNASLNSDSRRLFQTELVSDKTDYLFIKEEDCMATYDNRVGGGLMAGVEYYINPEISLESGIDYSAVNFSQDLLRTTTFWYVSKSGTEKPVQSGDADVHAERSTFTLSYLNLPVSVLYHFMDDKLAAGVGVIPSLFLNAKSESITNNNQFQKIGVAMQVQLRYRIANKFWLTSAFQNYSTKIYKADAKKSYSENRLLKIGLRYEI